MTRICIVGGALQGMEAAYLSHKAGFQTTIIDRRRNAPALSLADETAVMDPLDDIDRFRRIAETCDAVLPANENRRLLAAVSDIMRGSGTKLLFDIDSYDITNSKIKSNALMAGLGIPMPKKWPCGYPAIVKPSSMSGSECVSAVRNDREMTEAMRTISSMGDEPVVEEYVAGKNISVEVIGNGIEYAPYDLTEVVLNGDYDCKMVRRGPGDEENEKELGSYAVRVAEALGLRGIMDIESIEGPNGQRVLEIDARLPSQTPAAIYTATGTNLVLELYNAIDGKPSCRMQSRNCSIYEHLEFAGSVMRSCGEGSFANADSPYVLKQFFGCDEAITDYAPGKKRWYATLMYRGKNWNDLNARRSDCLNGMIRDLGITDYINESPKAII